MEMTKQAIQPSRFTRDGLVALRTHRLAYTLVAEDVLLEDASFFTFSYFAQTEDARRPVLFAFNGGPGSSSSMLHLGLYGPQLATEKGLVNNPDCLLDVCDIVMVDPPGTGWARILPHGSVTDYTGDLEDARALTALIRQWLRRYGRENSPVYLSGESFGATRASLAAALMQDINLRGILYVGPGYSSNWEAPRTLKDLVPAAAAAWYHGRAGAGRTLEDWVAQARSYLYGRYLRELYQGDCLDRDAFRAAALELSRLTALPVSYFESHKLLLSRVDFCQMLLSDEGLELGCFDMRATQPAGAEDEAFTRVYGPMNRHGTLDYFARLGLDTQREYQFSNHEINQAWRYGSEPSMADSLAAAMEQEPRLRVFFATGYYDIVATVENTRFSISHSGVPMERVTLREYPSGHMVYSDDVCRRALCQDIRDFLTCGKGASAEHEI